ncbi:MAG: diguanylate cyclase [Desulfarculus sp.]|nr:diguanylate cyclase [Desulfarculus sp.]
MNWRAPWRYLRDWPVGLKLPVTMALVVALTALAISYMLGVRGKSYIYDAAVGQLSRQLGNLVEGLPGPQGPVEDWEPSLEQAAARLQAMSGLGERLYFFALDPQGRLLFARPKAIPPTAGERQRMAQKGGGVIHEMRQGHPFSLVFAHHPGGLILGLRVDQAELAGPVLASLRRHTFWYTTVLCLLVVLVTAWLARRELTKPLLRLTEEAERVAGGDLTPPEPLGPRQDGLGRRSRALRGMALAAQAMVAEAQASQRRFQQLFTESRDAAFIVGPRGGIEDINPAGLAIFGYPDKKSMLALPGTAPLFADQEQRRQYLEQLGRQGYVQDCQVSLLRCDGSRLEALITASHRGQGEARFGLVRDVTQALADQRALTESEERHRRLLENAPDVIYRWSIPQGRYDYLSPAMEAISGYSPAEMQADPKLIWKLVLPQWREGLLRQWQALVRGEGPVIHEHEFRVERRDGQRRWVRERCILVRDAGGAALAIEGIVTDITAHKEAEQALERGQRMVEDVLQGLPAAVMVLNRRHQVVHWNRAMERLTGVPAAEVVGTSRQWHPFYPEPRPIMADLILDHDWQGMDRLYGHLGLKASTLIEGGAECEASFQGLGQFKERFLHFLAAPVQDEDGQVVRAVETLVDITDKRLLEEELRHLSVTDGLTGLYNQRFFYATLARELESARRYGTLLCLLMLDLDNFKSYNDRHGHLEGDRVLAASAQELRRQVRTTDLACRYGGEEFAVLLPRSSLEEALTVAQRVRQGIAALRFSPLDGQGQADSVTVSVGVADLRLGESPEELVSRADQALYTAKNQGRDRVAVYPAGGEIRMV